MTYNRTIGGLICLAICLFHANTFAVDATGDLVEIEDNEAITFSTTEGEGNTKPIATSGSINNTGSDSLFINVNGIYFAPGDFSGKNLTLKNDKIDYSDRVDYLVATMASGVDSPDTPNNRGISAAAIDFTGVESSQGNPFVVKLDNSGVQDYRFSAQVNNSNGYCGHVATAGVASV
jgi:hypothetical protein